GFTQKSAENFFKILQLSRAKNLFDIRVSKDSQLAGYTKRKDLPYFLKNLVKMEYHDMSILSPELSMMREFRKTGNWEKYKRDYLRLIRERQVEKKISRDLFEQGVVLLCSEAEATHCHRKLAAEYLVATLFKNEKAEIVHL
ncbi:MAG: hypothetical protein A2Z74_00505, partial [Chloroflexi bacterium RBG_13_46_9]